MTETQAVLWLVGVVGSVCAGVVTLDKVLDIINKYIKKAKAPDDAQDRRLDELEKRLDKLESNQTTTAEALARDLRRLDNQDEVNRLIISGIRNLLKSKLTGNNLDAIQRDADALDEYLMKGASTWKQS